jgi:hypothetical protein
LKKVLLHKIEVYEIDANELKLNHPFSYLATIDDIKAYGWTVEDAVKSLFKKLSEHEHREWALANGWIAPKLK